MAKETSTTGIANAALSVGGVGPLGGDLAGNYPDLSQASIEIIGETAKSPEASPSEIAFSPTPTTKVADFNFSVLTGPSLSNPAAAIMSKLPRLAEAGSLQIAAIQLAKRGVGGPLETLIVMPRAGGGEPE